MIILGFLFNTTSQTAFMKTLKFNKHGFSEKLERLRARRTFLCLHRITYLKNYDNILKYAQNNNFKYF